MTPLEALRAHPIFSILPDTELSKLSKRAVTRRWKKGQVLFRKGDACDGAHCVMSGCIVSIMEGENGEARRTGIWGPGQSVSSLPLLDGGVRIVTAVAHEPSSTVFLPRREHDAALASRPELKDRIISVLCQEIRSNYAYVEAGIFLDVPSRLARRILDLQQRRPSPDERSSLPSVNFSQEEIADMLGLSREWIGRELGRWRQAGIIDLQRSRLVIRDQAALKRISAGHK
jgi:CRP/FNR family transcriptional regulator/CRP/FNR family cyclic AMP-dependent transcriptional regulator